MSLLHTAAMLAAQSSTLPSKYCQKSNCPKFTVVGTCRSGDVTVEIRKYESAAWVGNEAMGPTSAVDHLWESTSSSSFMKNFRYIEGGNDEHKKINMTVPVRRVVSPSSTTTTSIRTSFFLPYKYQHEKNVPTPTDREVTIVKEPEQTLAVVPFGGWAADWERDVQPHVDALGQALTRAGVHPDSRPAVFVQSYDSPRETHNRHNEVAFVVPDGTKCDA